jgi:hypothetical protein
MANSGLDVRHSAGVAVGLSALAEGFGQAYNGQPTKAAAFLIAGLALSTASGLNTWLVRNVFRLKAMRIGPDRVDPALLTLWSVCYAFNLVDAWVIARRQSGEA